MVFCLHVCPYAVCMHGVRIGQKWPLELWNRCLGSCHGGAENWTLFCKSRKHFERLSHLSIPKWTWGCSSVLDHLSGKQGSIGSGKKKRAPSHFLTESLVPESIRNVRFTSEGLGLGETTDYSPNNDTWWPRAMQGIKDSIKGDRRSKT